MDRRFEGSRPTAHSLTSLLECPICLDTFKEPRTLRGCLHSYCHFCLQDHIDHTRSHGYFRCPVCRGEEKVPPSGAEGFPVSFLINSLLDAREIRPESPKENLTAVDSGGTLGPLPASRARISSPSPSGSVLVPSPPPNSRSVSGPQPPPNSRSVSGPQPPPSSRSVSGPPPPPCSRSVLGPPPPPPSSRSVSGPPPPPPSSRSVSGPPPPPPSSRSVSGPPPPPPSSRSVLVPPPPPPPPPSTMSVLGPPYPPSSRSVSGPPPPPPSSRSALASPPPPSVMARLRTSLVEYDTDFEIQFRYHAISELPPPCAFTNCRKLYASKFVRHRQQ